MALQGVGPNTSRRLSELNNDIFIHTLCDERATIDKHRIIADFNKLIKPIFSSYASKVFSPLARPTPGRDWDVIKDHRFGLHGMDLHPDGSPSPTKIPNPSSKIKEPTPPTSSKKIRKPALKKRKTG